MKNRTPGALGLWLGIVLVAGITGCQQVRPTARYGIDLVENHHHHPVARTFGGVGAVVGHLVAFPFSVLMLPSYPFEGAVVLNPDGYPELYRDEQGEPLEAEMAHALYPDIYLPLVLAPFEYGSGIGAAVFGGPWEYLTRGDSSPPPPEGTVVEHREPRPAD